MPAPESTPYLPTSMTIARAVRETPGVITIGFDVPGGFPFRPGQFNMLYAHGLGEVPISISGDAAEPTRLFHTIRAVGAVTRGMARMRKGSVLGVRGPYGSAWPVDDAKGRDVLFVAGGLGLAPLRPAILHVLANRAAYGRVGILCGARSPADLLFREDLQRWRAHPGCRLEVIVDRAGREWPGAVGVVTRLLDETPVGPDDAVFVCGPEIMMRIVTRELGRRGVPADGIWLSMERSMKCGVGLCGHCQLGGSFVCQDGPVYRSDRVAPWLSAREM
jgi:NAD(P)H-flavin reductase